MIERSNVAPICDAPVDAAVAYQYATLRVVPHVDREEFLNVGVLLYCQARAFLDARWSVPADRLRAFDPGLELDALAAMLASITQVCAGSVSAGPARLRLGTRFGWLTAPRSTVLQPGPVHGGVAVDPGAELDRLHRTLVHPRS